MTAFSYQPSDCAEIRQIMRDLHDRIFKILNRSDLYAAAKQLGIFYHGAIALDEENEQGLALFQDYLTYSYRPNKINMAELFLRINRDKLNAQEVDLLTRMSQAKFGLVQLQDADPVRHTIQTVNVLTNESFVVVDITASQQLKSTTLFVGHWMDCGSFFMQTGAGMALSRSLLKDAEPVISILFQKCSQGQQLSALDTGKLAKACVRCLLSL